MRTDPLCIAQFDGEYISPMLLLCTQPHWQRELFVWGASTSHPLDTSVAEWKFGTLAVGVPFAIVDGPAVMVL